MALYNVRSAKVESAAAIAVYIAFIAFLSYLALRYSNTRYVALMLDATFAIKGARHLAQAILILIRAPPVYAYYLGRDATDYYWFNGAGIWRDKRLFVPWDEVEGVEVPEKDAKGWGKLLESEGHKKLRIKLKDGREIEVKGVRDQEEVVEFIRENYLGGRDKRTGQGLLSRSK